MKIEIGESLMLSWLKHIKNCQMVQLNWKPSTNAWESYNDEIIDAIVNRVQEAFIEEYDVFKKNRGVSQIIRQGEIDALGMELVGHNIEQIYAVDVAFHENGLNYGDKRVTVAKILSKMTRMAITMLGCFDYKSANIIFSSPKINKSTFDPLEVAIDKLGKIFKEEFNLEFNFQLICNKGFRTRMINQLDVVSKEIADTSELYMRSIQLYKMFEMTFMENPSDKRATKIREVKDMNDLDLTDTYSDLKIGALVRLSLPKLLNERKLNDDEVNKLKDKSYSKEIFDINYPILKKIDNDLSLLENRYVEGYTRYYSIIISYKNEEYLITSEWYKRNKDKYVLWLTQYTE